MTDSTSTMASNTDTKSSTIPDEYKCIKQEIVNKGRWLQLTNITYQDAQGNDRIWEAVNRTTRPLKSDTDSVGVLAILKRTLRRDCYILVKQFRPPLDGLTIEFPAGLIGEGETPAEAALRELREETGYVGQLKLVGPAVAVDPGISNSTMRMVTVEIDGDNPNNLNPVQRAADKGFIKVLRVPVAEFLERLLEFSTEGIMIDSRVQSFSLGLAKGAPKNYHPIHAESVDEK